MAASQQSPLCLEDICMINIVLRLEEFPVQSLLLLPHAIRQRLYRGLSPADRLLYKDTGLFRYGDNDIINKVLLAKVLLTAPDRYNMVSLFYFSLSCLKEYHDYEQGTLSEHIIKCYTSLQFTVVRYRFLLPKRFLNYISVENGKCSLLCAFKDGISSLQQLLLQCNFKPPGNETITIDLCNFTQHSVVWKEFYKYFKETGEKLYESSKSIEVKMDPVILLMQTLLSTVENIEFGVTQRWLYLEPAESIAMASYVLLYNIITSEQPHLKSIKVNGECKYADQILAGIAKLCNCTKNCLPVCSNNKYQLELASKPILSLNFLKELMVRPINVTNKHAGSICELTRAIIVSQLHSLETVCIHGLGFTSHDMYSSKKNNTVPEYRALLCTLNFLLKKPQFVSMKVGRSPLPDVYPLIETFLCTEATHHQYLEIAGVIYEEERQWCAGHCTITSRNNEESTVPCEKIKRSQSSTVHQLHPPPARPLADNNKDFKSLDICRSSPLLHDWLASIPSLQLKELLSSTPELFPDNLSFVSRSNRYDNIRHL